MKVGRTPGSKVLTWDAGRDVHGPRRPGGQEHRGLRPPASARAQRGRAGLLPSLSIPTWRHFVKRQAWQDLRLRFVISHSLVAGQLYSMFPVTRHRQGCGRRPGPPPPSRGRMEITRPDLPLPLVPRFPEGSGSHSRRSETLVEICPTPFNTEIPGPEVWVGQAATAWKNGHPQALKAPLSWHFTPGKEYPLVLTRMLVQTTSPYALQPRAPIMGKTSRKLRPTGPRACVPYSTRGPGWSPRGYHFPLTESRLPHLQSLVVSPR